ncbi:type II secretion system minor pseudopilin GspK [Vogesella urethralis]|uniref:type II secretion system minor pseudopilin GspK n=1 Tax=Vogesella urethralis TaxID=2592656 RepID=UPI001186A18B|nr:type II secretion system minor pseudopilin GspK [Vogesella urethralis]
MKRQQQGMAIIMALLIVALAATAAATVLWQQSLWWRQADNDRARADIRLIADAGTGWAGDILAFDARSSGAVDYPGELWAQPLPQTEAEQTRISGQLSDAQGRFNVRNLMQQDGKPDELQAQLYRRLLQQLQLPAALADTLLDWLDDDNDARAQGAEADWYAALPAPYAIPPLASLRRVEQLRWVKGYTPQVLATLAPHLAVLPQRTAINVNTASLPLLMALVPGLGRGQAQALANQRQSNYFKDRADFGLRLTGGLTPLAVDYGVRSDFFLLDSTIRHPRSVLRVQALLQRNEQASKVWWRDEGVVPAAAAGAGEP